MKCRCGATELLATEVEPRVANRIICYCSGCQQFAKRFAPEILDEWGGTERIQVSPATVSIARGKSTLRCVQQTPRGALRWVAGCCDTGMGLTLRKNNVPFVGLDLFRVDALKLALPIEDVVGPLRVRVNGDFSRAQARDLNADALSLLRMLAHLAPLSFRWWRAGAHHRSPFFVQGEPVVDVEKLYDELPATTSLAGCR